MLVLLRLGTLRRERRAQGWSAEERVRDPRGWRAPLAEAAGATALIAAVLAIALLPPYFGAFAGPPDDVSIHPVRVAEEGEDWVLEFPAPVPADARLLLTLRYGQAPVGGSLALVDDADQRAQTAPGELLSWPLSPAQAQRGRVLLRPDPEHPDPGAEPALIATVSRLQVPLPGRSRLSALLFALLLFFLPLPALLLTLERFLRVDGLLAALATLFLAGLAAFRPPAELALPDSAAGWMAGLVLGLKRLLPDVQGLYAVGAGYELRVGTTATVSILAWLGLGLVFLLPRLPPAGAAPMSRTASRIVAALLGLLFAAGLAGAGPLPGAEAARSLRGWWNARLFEDATGRDDYRRMVALGETLLTDTADGVPLRFALERMALEGSAATQGRVPADALAWSSASLLWMDRVATSTIDPWGASYLRALLLLDRVVPLTGDPSARTAGVAAAEIWLASGGGPYATGAPEGSPYALLLNLPVEQRAQALEDAFLVGRDAQER